MNGAMITVSQLNRYVKSVLDGDLNLKTVFVVGEISNLKVNSFSGHMYFTLKDETAAVKAVMFKSSAARLKFMPKEGMRVICRGSVTLYERDGAYQLYAGDMQPDGAGSIALAFEQLKEKLAKEGLFDEMRKKPLPRFPKKIAVVTSETGAAVQDMINVLGRRWPVATIVMCPVRVQGDTAAGEMCVALKRINESTDCDCIIIGRGGGSAEDLWCFNDEILARCVAASKIPVISAVGHETDFTICDFAADRRAPTPSAAAEIAVPDIREVANGVDMLKNRLTQSVTAYCSMLSDRLELLSNRRVLKDPFATVERAELNLDSLVSRLEAAYTSKTAAVELKLENLIAKLDALDPIKILQRGYSVTKKNCTTVKSVNDIEKGDCLTLLLSDGSVECTVVTTERKH